MDFIFSSISIYNLFWFLSLFLDVLRPLFYLFKKLSGFGLYFIYFTKLVDESVQNIFLYQA